ncbi:MAG: C69 family dipeptidase [Bacteroidales bacterium]|nr:C69 family dipeptidase [Bacteroidales bacterium]
MKRFCLSLLGVIFSFIVVAQVNPGDPWFGESCTSIMAGKAATVDGSVITAHTCDGNYRTWLRMEKAAEHPDTAVYKVYKGTLHTETPWDMRNVELAGEIPQVAKTFAYLNTAYPSMNEKQLAMGETTFVGPDTLVNKNGMFLIEELQRIALQRCDNARDAITLIGELIEEYGYGDWGECITIADKHEVWQMEILGAGPDEIGGVWAAQRIPDDHVGVSANISRIGVIDRKNKDYFMASKNVEKVAKKYGLWDGKGEFKFWKAYADRDKPFMIREFYILSTLAPSLELSMDMEELPFSVKPDEKVDLQTISSLYRATYEGTPYDMTQNIKMVKKRYEDRKIVGEDTIISPIAHPWPTGDFRNTMNYLQKDMVEYQRTVAVSWCSYSHIMQLRDWLPDEIGGVSWFSFDNPAESPRVPIFAGVSDLPESFNYCGQKRYREDAALWDYRKANKLATVGWGKTKESIEESVLWFEEKAAEELPMVENKAEELLNEDKKEEATEYLTNYLRDFEAATKNKWKLLEIRFWELFGRGF